MIRDVVTKETRNLMFHTLKAYMQLESDYGMELYQIPRNKEMDFIHEVQDLFDEAHTALHNIKMVYLKTIQKE